jgi:mono/diheme cytochrome c family protein
VDPPGGAVDIPAPRPHFASLFRHESYAMHWSLKCSLVVVSWLLWNAVAPRAAQAAEPLQYNRDIRPILANNCFACHGADSAARQADLRIDERDMAIDRETIVPGDPDASEMIRRILSDDPDEAMPPPKTKKTIKPEDLAKLRQWITEGAEYEPHWSLIPPTKTELPKVKNGAWVKNPIDSFILAKLEAAGLAPAEQADRRTLARRVSLDLTGLPPEPALVEEFVNDQDANAYEKLVDKLLASKQWGEHRGRYWLDVARYADTHGIHFDNFREMWSYRDWVINAFNKNQPFDQFTIEQLAGDLLPNRTVDQQVASGFNRCNITTNEGGAIAEEYLVLYARDRTETVGITWMGSTVGCAVCHDHKFDPFTQKEFYSLAAFFNNTTQNAMDGNIKDTPPIIKVPYGLDRERLDALAKEIPAAQAAVEARKAAARQTFDQWLAERKPDDNVVALPTESLYVHAPLAEGQGKVTLVSIEDKPREVAINDKTLWQPGPQNGQSLQPQGAVGELGDVGDFEREQPFTAAAWVRLPANDGAGALAARMDNTAAYRGWDFWLQRRQIGSHIINTWPGNALKVVGKAQVPANEWTHVAVTYDGSSKAAGVKIYYNGQPQETLVEADALRDTIRTKVPFKIGQRHSENPISGVSLSDLRVYKRALSPAEISALSSGNFFASILAKPADQRTDAEKNQLFGWWIGTNDEEYKKLSATVAALEKEQADMSGRGTIAHVMQERDGEAMAFVLNRGEYDKRKEQVKPATPAALPPMPDDLPRNRLGLAQWLLRPDHPLTARVTVNRFWQQVFGTGIVRTSGDFGVMGELPTHPELLDWLAVDFRENGWDVKRFFKQLVMSAAYQQAAIATPEKLNADPDNRLLSRGPRFRLEAEEIRDYALAASGLLVPKLGGPSVKPYQPPGVWEAVAMIGSNTRDYRADTGENLYRRSMYTFWKRAAPPASMDIFNATAREVCTTRRERTNTPLQALVTLNDTQFVEAARVLAQRTLKEGGADDAAKLDFLAKRLLARPLTDAEKPIVATSLADLLAFYKAKPDDAAKLLVVGESKRDESLDAPTHAAWTMLTNQMMNLDEVLNK